MAAKFKDIIALGISEKIAFREGHLMEPKSHAGFAINTILLRSVEESIYVKNIGNYRLQRNPVYTATKETMNWLRRCLLFLLQLKPALL